MKRSPSQIKKQFSIAHPVGLAMVIVVLIGLGAAVYRLTLPETYGRPAVFERSPEPSPGTPGNPGDLAKQSSPMAQPSNSPSPSSAPAPAKVSIDNFSIVPERGGSIHPIDYVYGASYNACNLTLTQSGKPTATFVGETQFDGSYYNCAFGSMGNVSSGNWQATLTVSGAGGAAPATATTTFTEGS